MAEPVVAIHSAPYIFTKLMKPVVVTMKSLGIRMVFYLDDMILMANSQGAPLVCSQSPNSLGVHTECGQECNIIKSPNRILRIQSGFHHHDDILTIPGIYLTGEISSTTSRWDTNTTERHCTSVRNDGGSSPSYSTNPLAILQTNLERTKAFNLNRGCSYGDKCQYLRTFNQT